MEHLTCLSTFIKQTFPPPGQGRGIQVNAMSPARTLQRVGGAPPHPLLPAPQEKPMPSSSGFLLRGKGFSGSIGFSEHLELERSLGWLQICGLGTSR